MFLALLYLLLAALPMGVACLTDVEPVRPLVEFATALGLCAAALLYLQFPSSGRHEQLSGRIGIDRTMGFHRVAAGTLLLFAILHPLGYAIAGASGDPALANGIYSGETPVRLAWLVLALLAGLAVLTLYVLRPLRMWREGWVVERVVRIGERALEMSLRGPASTAMRFRAGQFIWLSIAPDRPPFHDHPFSIASAPGELPLLRLVIGEVGNCTRRFMQIAPGTAAAIDGPHGSFTLPPGHGPVLLVAGGIGIAPMLGILADAAARNERRPYRLLYAARNRPAMIDAARLDALRARLDLSVRVLLDEGPLESGEGRGPVAAGHIRALLEGLRPDSVQAMLCGPARMMEQSADALLAAGVQSAAIHYERFDFGAGKGRLDRRRRRQALSVFLALLVLMGLFSLRGP